MSSRNQDTSASASESLSLGDLAIAGYLYGYMTDYEDSLEEFRALVGGVADLGNPEHRLGLLRWLNRWGCQHLAKDCHRMASDGLNRWWERFQRELPDVDCRLVSSSHEYLDRFADAFDSLSAICAARKHRGGREILVSFGPTAAAKTLFVLRPHLFVAWDDPIRSKLGLDRSVASYMRFLDDARAKLQEAQKRCTGLGVDLDELAEVLGRGGSTAAELVNAYYWITLTKGVPLPDRAMLERWLVWSADG